MKPQTAFIVISVVLLLAVLYLAIYVTNTKNKAAALASNIAPVTPVPQIKRTVQPAVTFNPYPQSYLNSFGNPELIRTSGNIAGKTKITATLPLGRPCPTGSGRCLEDPYKCCQYVA